MPTESSSWIGDPLYQVNLVLWMLQPQVDPRINGILRRAGSTLRAIEPDLTLPRDLSGKLRHANITVRDPVQPDIALDGPDRMIVLMECKATMFGDVPQPGQGDGQIRQARSLLLQGPAVLASALGLQRDDVSGTFVLYLSRHQEGVDQAAGLKGIASALGKAGFQTTPFGLCGLRVVDDGIALCPCATHPELPGALSSHFAAGGVLVRPVADDDDPRPLYFLPWIPGAEQASDDYGKAVFSSSVLGAAVASIARARPPCSVELITDDLIRAATHGLYDRWRNRDAQKCLRSRVRDYLRRQIQNAAPKAPLSAIGNPSVGWRVVLEDEKVQARIVEGFRKCEPGAWNEPVEPTLEDMLEDDA